MNGKPIIIILIIIIIALIGAFLYMGTSFMDGVATTANVNSVEVTNWDSKFWNTYDKMIRVEFTPIKNINLTNGEVDIKDVIIKYSDGSSEKSYSFVGEPLREKQLLSGERYTVGSAFNSSGKVPVHVSGKVVTGVNGSMVIASFDSDV